MTFAPLDRESGGADETAWGNVDEGTQDPEEVRVIFSALDSFRQYAKATHFKVTHLRRRSFYALPRSHQNLLNKPPIGYLDTLVRADEAIDCNAELGHAILQAGLRAFGSIAAVDKNSNEPVIPDMWHGVAKDADIDKAKSTIRQFFRDWSAEGEPERIQCYGPIMSLLERERGARAPGEMIKVLVPGAGLGRLVFDLALKGFATEGNEISYHQLLASSYILNDCAAARSHTIYPWVHSFSNHLSREKHLRGYQIPDIHPATILSKTPNAGPISMSASDFLCLYASDENKEAYDAVASVFFLDTAPNLVRYLDVIWHCLRPNGVLVNVGPLLWHFEDAPPGNNGFDDDGDGEHDPNNSTGIADPGSFELCEDETIALIEKLGFRLEKHQTDHEAPYIHDDQSMLQTVYRAHIWLARKVERPSESENAELGKFETLSAPAHHGIMPAQGDELNGDLSR